RRRPRRARAGAGRRPGRHRLRRAGDRVGPSGDVAVRARTVGKHHRAPVRHAGPGNSRGRAPVATSVTSAQTGTPGRPEHLDGLVHLEVWTDIACPWCYIGATRLAAALEDFDRADRIRVTWRSYELNPDAEAGAGRREIDALVDSKDMTPDQVRHMFGQVRSEEHTSELQPRFD